MSESVPLLSPPGVDGEPVPVASLDSESRFYGGYARGLNAYPTVREVVDHLREEVRRLPALDDDWRRGEGDRKSTRLNSSHVSISYAVLCLQKKHPVQRNSVHPLRM